MAWKRETQQEVSRSPSSRLFASWFTQGCCCPAAGKSTCSEHRGESKGFHKGYTEGKTDGNLKARGSDKGLAGGNLKQASQQEVASSFDLPVKKPTWSACNCNLIMKLYSQRASKLAQIPGQLDI